MFNNHAILSQIKICLLLLLLINCTSKEPADNRRNNQDIFITNYGKINDKNLKLRFGDKIEFNINNIKINALVLDVKSEESDIWFGLCFLKGNELFGRRIPKGFNGECINLLDFSYLNEKGLTNYQVLERKKVDFNKVRIGSDSPIINIQQVLRNYETGIEVRKLKETECKKKLHQLDPINECYFNINSIIIN